MTDKKFTIAKKSSKDGVRLVESERSGGSSTLSDFSRANWSRAATWSLKVMLHGTIRNDDFSATQRYNVEITM